MYTEGSISSTTQRYTNTCQTLPKLYILVEMLIGLWVPGYDKNYPIPCNSLPEDIPKPTAKWMSGGN